MTTKALAPTARWRCCALSPGRRRLWRRTTTVLTPTPPPRTVATATRPQPATPAPQVRPTAISTIYNWAEYIDEEQLAEFEEEFGVTVTIDSLRLQRGHAADHLGRQLRLLDLIVPSDYMVSILIAAGDARMPLNKDAIPNVSNLVRADFVSGSGTYDPDGRVLGAVPVGHHRPRREHRSVVGDRLPPDSGASSSTRGSPSTTSTARSTLLNDPRETLGAALKYLGYSLNTTDEAELDEATRQLVADATGRLAAFNTDSADELLDRRYLRVIAHGYSGDMFVQFLETENPSDYVYFVPEEGGTRWIDNFAIAHDAPHPCTAHTFINWMYGAEQGAALTNWNYYNTPNAAAVDGLDEDLLDFVNDPAVLAGGVDSLESLEDTGDFEVKYSDAFVEAKG